MRYGYFDDERKEYVIEQPDTPTSWSNYLGSTEFGSIITNNAGGYSFYKSGARGRFLRMNFNSMPMDQPGRYFYLRDNADGDFWSASWQPVGKPLDEYQSVCRHGTAYTIIESEYRDIASKTTYFVPLGETFECWLLKLENKGNTPRELSLFSYCEFTNQWDTFQDRVNLQYSIFITQTEVKDNLLRVAIQDNFSQVPDNGMVHNFSMKSWMGLVGAEVAGYDTSREAFLGNYGGYHNPDVVRTGVCTNSLVYGENACGTFQSNIKLEPGECREVLVLIGIGEAGNIGKEKLAQFGSVETAKRELQKLKDHWHARLESMIVNTPDAELNHTINVWGLYNCLITFAWSRAASLIYNGERDGLGFRDSVQDIIGVAAAIPDLAGERLELMLSGQLANGGAIPVIKPFEHNPGQEKPPDESEYRSDDCLWFFNAVPTYVNETGRFDFYEKMIPFADEGEASVLEHLRRALEFNLNRMGKHGLPCGLSADWNDCLQLGYFGESVFVTFQLRLGLTVYAEISERLKKTQEAEWALQTREKLDAYIQEATWDGDWFVWAIGEDGTVYGSKEQEEGQIYLNTQLWAVISGAANVNQAERCLQFVYEKLATPYGLMLCAPPFVKTTPEVMRAVVFNPGIKENAGIFNHTQGWGIMAECIQGNAERAYDYLRANMPAAYNEQAELRQIEPYVQGQTTYSTFSPRAGNTRVPWLTGAAAWFYYSATQYVLGIRPEWDGLRIDPCIPAEWKSFSVKRRFRGKEINIEVQNPSGVNKGIKSVVLNGSKLPDNLLHIDLLEATNLVKIQLG